MCGNSMRENREVPRVPVGDRETGRLEKATNHTSNMNALGKSDGRIVPTKPPNNGQELQPAEAVEGRRPTKGNAQQDGHAPDTGPGSRVDRPAARAKSSTWGSACAVHRLTAPCHG